MKVSLNWLKDYIEISNNPSQLTDRLTSLGLESYYKKIEPTFNRVVLGKVIECKKHLNSDHLHICKVKVSDDKVCQIICGAPNISSDIYVPVALVGAELLDGKFIIKKSKIRGEVSEGMICSGKELGINNDESGIMIIDDSESVGEPFEDIIGFKKDVLIDIDITPNRGDCLGHLGVAREIALFSENKLKINKNKKIEYSKNKIDVQVHDSSVCARYMAIEISGIKVEESPQWLQDRLHLIGQNSINNIVDATNYIQYDLGHPMHAFDSEMIDGRVINIRNASSNEKIVTLDGVTRKLDSDCLVIADRNKALALAGIIGGIDSSVSDKTSSITIECAYFDPINIRKTSKRLGVSTESSKRFERNTDIEIMGYAINKLANLIIELAGGKISSTLVDVKSNNNKINKIKFNLDKCNSFLGTSLNTKEVKNIFSSLNINCSKGEKTFTCSIPSYRNDIEFHHDLIEEIARVYGYENISNSSNFTIPISSIDNAKDTIRDIRTYFSHNGYHEHVSNSLVSDSDLYMNNNDGVELSNPLSNDMRFMRNSILPGLFAATLYNQNRNQEIFKIFEVGAVHHNSKNGIIENINLGFVCSESSPKHWRGIDKVDIFSVKSEIEKFFKYVDIDIDFDHIDGKINILNEKKCIGIISNSRNNQNINYKQNVFYGELYLDDVVNLINTTDFKFSEITQYPSANRDIAIQVDNSVNAGALISEIMENGTNLLSSVNIFDLYESDELKENSKSIAFSLSFESNERTLNDSEVDKIVDRIISRLVKKFNAVQR